MTTDSKKYLSQYIMWGAFRHDSGNTEFIKSTNPSHDKFLYHDHKMQPLPPNSRHLSTQPSTYMM